MMTINKESINFRLYSITIIEKYNLLLLIHSWKAKLSPGQHSSDYLSCVGGRRGDYVRMGKFGLHHVQRKYLPADRGLMSTFSSTAGWRNNDSSLEWRGRSSHHRGQRGKTDVTWSWIRFRWPLLHMHSRKALFKVDDSMQKCATEWLSGLT